MPSVTWTQRYEVNTLVVNPHKRLGLVGLLKILQDVAWIHGGHLGHGFEAMMAKGWIWVLARHKLVASDWPAWGEAIEVRTWVRPVDGLLVLRDYEVWAGPRKVAESTASWLIVDAATRRPVKVSMGRAAVLTREDATLDLTPAKLPARDDLTPLARFQVRNSDLDVNGHVNNIHYAQWILDAVPASAHRDQVVRDYEVNFLAETSVGDQVVIEGGGAALHQEPGGLSFQGRREADGKAVFTARLRVGPPPAAGE